VDTTAAILKLVHFIILCGHSAITDCEYESCQNCTCVQLRESSKLEPDGTGRAAVDGLASASVRGTYAVPVPRSFGCLHGLQTYGTMMRESAAKKMRIHNRSGEKGSQGYEQAAVKDSGPGIM